MKPQPQGCEACILRLCKNHCNRSSGWFIIFATGPDLTHNVTVCEPMRLLYGGQLTPHTQLDCFIASYCFDITLVSRSYSFDRLVSKCFVVAAASVCLFICLSVHLFTCLSVHLFNCLSIHLFTCLSVHLFNCLSVHRFTCLSVHLLTCSSVLLFAPPTQACSFSSYLCIGWQQSSPLSAYLTY